MNALSPDLRAFVQQGVLTLPQAAGMMHANQQPPPDNAAAADGHEETKEGDEEDRGGQPPPPSEPKPIKVTRALLVAFAREHLLRTQQFLSFLAMMPADDPLHTALLTALSETKLPLSNYVLCGDSACADPSGAGTGAGTAADHPDEPPTQAWRRGEGEHSSASQHRHSAQRAPSSSPRRTTR